jgi:hypothetical protein
MITDAWHFAINCVSNGPQPITVFITVPFNPIFGVPQPNITVTMAVSAFAQGFEGDRSGAIGASITHYQHVNARGEIEDVDVPADFFYNAIDIDQAYAVTLALTAEFAWAWAQVTILFRN